MTPQERDELSGQLAELAADLRCQVAALEARISRVTEVLAQRSEPFSEFTSQSADQHDQKRLTREGDAA